MQVFVIINNPGTKISLDLKAKNWLAKVHMTKDLFRVLVFVIINVINYVT